MSEPREYWIKFEGVNGECEGAFRLDKRPYQNPGDEIIRVIEKSAYDALKAEHDKWFKQSAVVEAALKQKCAAYERALEEISKMECSYGEDGCDSDDKRWGARIALGKK